MQKLLLIIISLLFVRNFTESKINNLKFQSHSSDVISLSIAILN